MVLIVSAAAATAALTGLAARHATDERQQTTADLADARIIARSGIEAALQSLNERTSWRGNLTSPAITNYTISPGTVRVTITDEIDGDFSDNATDPYKLASAAVVGNASVRLTTSVTYETADPFQDRALALGPIAYWPFDEDEGARTVTPLVGPTPGNYSVPTVAGLATGPFGDPAPRYTATTEFAFIPHYDALLLDDGTIVLHAFVGSTKTGTQTILAKNIEGDNGNGSIHIYMDGATRELSLRMESSARTRELDLGTLEADSWHQIAVSFGNNGLSGYVDGSGTAKMPSFRTGIGTNAGGSGNTHTLTLGVWHTGTEFVQSINGSVRDVIIYDRQLSDSEIADLASSSDLAPVIEPETWAWTVD